MKRYNTPHRNRVIKTRLTEEEYARSLPFPRSMMNCLQPLGNSQLRRQEIEIYYSFVGKVELSDA